jgi:hypothetical protein
LPSGSILLRPAERTDGGLAGWTFKAIDERGHNAMLELAGRSEVTLPSGAAKELAARLRGKEIRIV